MSFSIMGQFVAATTLLEAAPTAFQNIMYRFWVILICLMALYGTVGLFLPAWGKPDSVTYCYFSRSNAMGCRQRG